MEIKIYLLDNFVAIYILSEEYIKMNLETKLINKTQAID